MHKQIFPHMNLINTGNYKIMAFHRIFEKTNLKTFVLWFFLHSAVSMELIDWSDKYANQVGFENPLFCTENKKCMPIDHCPDMLLQMNEKMLPIHSFRQLVCGYVGISPKVCCDLPKELSTHVLITQSIPSHSRLNLECGKSLIRSNLETLGTYPFVARIGFINVISGETKYPCSGTILNDRTILTTATCALATSDTYKLHSVLVGEFDAATDPDCNSLFCGHTIQQHNISYIVKHPSFHTETFRNNVALLYLKSSINFTVTAQPVCLLFDQEYNIVETTATLVGWGKISQEKEKPTKQQWLAMKLLPKQECSIFVNRRLSVELCALGQQEPCSGYSGSPLIQKYGDTYTLVGILSYGSDCDIDSNSPSVFVNVQRYAKWILENS